MPDSEAQKSARQPERLSDSELVALTRDGESAAYAELWRRHYSAGLAVARSFTATFDADDLVSESFANIFKRISQGGGPTTAFRAYLYTSIRNTAASWSRKTRAVPLEHIDQVEDSRFTEESQLEAFDRSLAAQAFRRLPSRWQEVLWYSEVEGMSPREIGPLLAMSANSVAALAYRAREGLRQAWIESHLASLPADSECRWTIEQIAAKLRGKLPRSKQKRVDAHLSTCETCPIVVEEAEEANRRIAFVLLPLAAGIGGAAALTAWQSTQGTAASAETLTTTGAALGGRHSAGAGAPRHSSVLQATSVAVAALTVLAASAAIASMLSDTLGRPAAAPTHSRPIAVAPPPDGTTQTPSLPAAPPVAGVPPLAYSAPVPSGAPPAPTRPVSVIVPLTPVQSVAAPLPTPAAVVVPPVPLAFVQPVVESPAGGSVLTGDSVLVSGTGTPGATITIQLVPQAATIQVADAVTTVVDPSGKWSALVTLSSLSSGTYTLTAVQSANGHSAASASVTVTVRRPIASPTVSSVDTGSGPLGGHLYPIVSGTAAAGATVTIAATGRTTAVTADASGAWSALVVDGVQPGTTILSITQTGTAGDASPAVQSSVAIAPPDVSVSSGTILVSGTPLATIQVRSGQGSWSSATLGADGTWRPAPDGPGSQSPVPFSARYAADDRFGPTMTVDAGR